MVVHGQTAQSTVEVEAQILNTGGRAWSLARNLAERNAGTKLIEEAERLTGGIDILVINASAQINATLERLDQDDLAFQLDVNLRSTVDLLQACLPRMAERGWGRIVSIGSVNQLRPKDIVTGYAATKAAQHNIIQSQAREFARKGVLMNTLAPGLVRTDRNRDRRESDPEGWQRYVGSVNWMGREGQPEELVGAAIFLSSDACSFMTGETVFVTGGV